MSDFRAVLRIPLVATPENVMPRIALPVLSLLVLCGALACPRADAAVTVLRVGADAACGYRTDILVNAFQSAIDAVPVSIPAGDSYVIRLARNGSYSGTNYWLLSRSVVIEGGYETCASDSPGSNNTVLDGTGNPANALLRILRATDAPDELRREVVLRRLTLRNNAGGVVGSQEGGGLFVRGANVRLESVIVSNNSAGRGGGIYIDGSGVGARLILDVSSAVTDNTAQTNGGGIHCTLGAELGLVPNTSVMRNAAGDSGGGLFIDGCLAQIDTGGTGLLGALLSISANTATDGGGIAASNGSRVFIGLSNTADSHPLIINNTASSTGGGIHVQGAGTRVDLFNPIIASNKATHGLSYGGGLMANAGASVFISRTRTRCPAVGNGHCSRISGNSAAFGGAIAVTAGATLEVTGTRIQGNTATQGGSAYLAIRGDAGLFSGNNVIVGNTGPSVVQMSEPEASPPRQTRVWLLGDTIADNPDATRVVEANADGQVRFGRTIVNAPAGVPVATCTTCTTQVAMHCNVFHSATNVGHHDAMTSITVLPGFVNAADGNYRLRPNAWAIDRCPEQTGFLNYDHELSPRPYDSPLFDVGGPFDVGAYEWNPILFQDGFED